jgi:hypothetical protein
MHRRMCFRLLFFTFSSLLLSLAAFSQSQNPTPVRDPQAVSILTQSLNAVGGLSVINAIQDYTSTGTITYNWTDQPVQCSVTLRGKGLSGFRMDATLPVGVQTLAVNGLSGRMKTADGQVKHLAAYNFVNAGSLSFPTLRLLSALSNQNVGLSLVGSVQAEGHQTDQVRATFPVDPTLTASVPIADLGTLDFFIDSTSFQLVKISENVRSEKDATVAYLHEVVYTNYQPVGGIAAPFGINEKIEGQQTWSISVQSTSFNSGLSDSEFIIN